MKSISTDNHSFIKSGAISKADFDNATNQYKMAKAQVGTVTAQLSTANKNLSLRIFILR
jgi:outer membrane protein TolC